MPVIRSTKRQIALGLFGLVLLVSGAYVQVSLGRSLFLPKLEGTTWVGTTWEGTSTYPPNAPEIGIRIVFGADTAVVSINANGTRLNEFNFNEYCSWAASGGTIRLNCPYVKVTGIPDQPFRLTMNSVYEVHINGLSMTGTVHYSDRPDQQIGSVSLMKKLD